MAVQQIRKESFVDRDFPFFQSSKFIGIVVDRDDIVPHFSKTRCGDETYIPRPDNCDAHAYLFLGDEIGRETQSAGKRKDSTSRLG